MQEKSPEVSPSAIPEISITPKVNVLGEPALLIRAVDMDSEKPISDFLVVAGIPIDDGLIDPKFAKAFTRQSDEKIELVNWQSHKVRAGKDGKFTWATAKIYNPLCLRVEAKGYIPQQITGIDKSKGSQTIVFRLSKDKFVKGRVLLADGKPAAGAIVGIGITSAQLKVQEGEMVGFGTDHKTLRSQWCHRPMVKTDEDGNFMLPTETDQSAKVVAVHDGGIAYTHFADLQEKKTMKLQEWGTVKGEVIVEEETGLHEEFTLYVDLERAAYPNSISCWVQKQTDMSGSFVVEKVPPGSGKITLPKYIPKSKPGWRQKWERPKIPRNAIKSFHVAPGQTLELKVGGRGLVSGGDAEIQVLVEIDANGDLKINGNSATFAELAKIRFDSEVTVKPSKGVDYDVVVKVLGELNDAIGGVSFDDHELDYDAFQKAMNRVKKNGRN